MHLSLMLLAITTAWIVRQTWQPSHGSWTERWQKSLGYFLFAPLLVLLTAVAVVGMGTQGQMVGFSVGQMGYWLAIGILAGAGAQLLRCGWQGWRSLRQIQQYSWFEPNASVGPDQTPVSGRLIETSALFAAQVGFWQSQLVVSRGLVEQLAVDQLQAVLTHEQAHAYYRDTFWFFWLGWLRCLTTWLPHSESLWQELLLLRELRADQWAAQQVDPLLVAESLLTVVRSSLTQPSDPLVALSANFHLSRLEERIDALLSTAEPAPAINPWRWSWLWFCWVPLLTVLLHR